jgi:segregation and condensation protein B
MPLQDDQNEDFYYSFPIDMDDDEAILSFDKLREAFANLNSEAEDMNEKESLHPPSSCLKPDFDENGEAYESIDSSEEEYCEISPRMIFEAMLFVGNRENKPLAAERAAGLMRNVSPEELVEIVQELNEKYARVNAPYHITCENDGYRMVLRPEFEAVRSRFYSKTRETKLSQGAIDVLAIVAYQQPITADEVQQIRKSASQAILQQLVRRGLIHAQKILNKKKKEIGRAHV